MRFLRTAFTFLMERILRKCDENVTKCRVGLESPAHLVYDKLGFYILKSALVAQLDRALASDARCRWFESSQVRYAE